MVRKWQALFVVLVSLASVLILQRQALACRDDDPLCGGSEQRHGNGGGGKIEASAAGKPSIRVKTDGGGYPSKTTSVPVPENVLPPCYYVAGKSGAEMAADQHDPNLRRVARGIGDDFKDWFPPDTAAHAVEDGNWYSWVCSSETFGTDFAAFDAFVDKWSAANPPWRWVGAGDPVPEVPVPPEILEGIARQAMADAVVMPTVHFNPAQRSVVNLDTWMWIDQAAWHPVSVTASSGGVSVTVTATPGRVDITGLPAGSTTDTGCAHGGKVYAGAGSTDCLIRFGRSSGGQPGQEWGFNVSLTWDVVSVGAPLIGPATIETDADQAMQVREVQVVGAGD
jgi:enoyl reductase